MGDRARGRGDSPNAGRRAHAAARRRGVLPRGCRGCARVPQRRRADGALRDAVDGPTVRRRGRLSRQREDQSQRARLPAALPARARARVLGGRVVSDPNLFTLEVQPDEDDAPGYRVAYKRVGPLVGAVQLGLSVYELTPGNSVCPYHYEVGMEEWLLVLVGRPTLRTPDGEQELRAWDLAFFPGDE